MLDDVWYTLDGGLGAGTGKTVSLPLLRRCPRIEDVSADFL